MATLPTPETARVRLNMLLQPTVEPVIELEEFDELVSIATSEGLREAVFQGLGVKIARANALFDVSAPGGASAKQSQILEGLLKRQATFAVGGINDPDRPAQETVGARVYSVRTRRRG